MEFQDAFEVGEQHLHLFALTARGPVRLGLGDVARHVASALVDGARDLAGGCLRTALRFQGTSLAIQLAGAIAHHAVLIDERARHSVDFLALPEFLPGRADIAVALVVVGKRVAREGAVGALRFVEDRDVRLNPLLMDQPIQHLGRAIGAVADEALGIEIEACNRPLDHALGCRHLGLTDRRRRLDIDNDRVLDIDQIVVRIGEEGRSAVHRAAGSAGAMNLGVTSVAAPNTASSRTARYSSTARPAASGGRPAAPSTRVRSLASAWIRLASTAKPSPPTSPSSMQRCNTVSNSRRSRSLSRKRPWRFFEKVE